MLTQTQILHTLHLQPFDEFDRLAKTRAHYPCQSGRTTRLLVEAIELASRGEKLVLVSADHREMHLLQQQLLAITARLYRLNPGTLDIRFAYRAQHSPNNQAVSGGLSSTHGRAILEDHTAALTKAS